MIILGLLILIAAIVFGLDVLFKNHFRIPSIHAFGSDLGIHGARPLFVLGAIVGAGIVLGLALMAGGTSRRSSIATRRRQERRQTEDAMGELEGLRAENTQLRARLDERTQADRDIDPPATD